MNISVDFTKTLDNKIHQLNNIDMFAKLWCPFHNAEDTVKINKYNKQMKRNMARLEKSCDDSSTLPRLQWYSKSKLYTLWTLIFCKHDKKRQSHVLAIWSTDHPFLHILYGKVNGCVASCPYTGVVSSGQYMSVEVIFACRGHLSLLWSLSPQLYNSNGARLIWPVYR